MEEVNKQSMNYIKKYEKIITEQGKANHEFKNQLMVIKGYAQMKSPKLLEYLNTLIEDNNKVELTKESLVKCNEIYECGDEVRYIKFESNGSNKNSGNHLSRLIIYDMNNTEELILDSSIGLMPTVTSGSCV